MDRNSTSVSGGKSNARGQMQPATTEAGHPLTRNLDCYLEKYSKSVQGTFHI